MARGLRTLILASMYVLTTAGHCGGDERPPMNPTTTKTIDLGNHESVSRGVFPGPDGFLALDYTASRTFKTRGGAERWLARRAAVRS